MIDSLFIQHGAMTVRRVRTQTRIDPQAQAVAKRPANLSDGFAGGIVGKRALLLFGRDRKQQELRDAIREISFDLLQSRGSVVTNGAAQSGDWFVALDPFHYKKRLNQLRASEFGFGVQIAQVLRSWQTHQTFHSDISSNSVRTRSGSDGIILINLSF